MQLRSLKDFDVFGKKVLYRAPYDIELVEKDGQKVLKDLSRIEVTLPTLRYLIEQQCRIVVLTYVGRPEGHVVEDLKTNPHAAALSQLLGVTVKKLDDCVGEDVSSFVGEMKLGDIVMLENTRFHLGEEEDDDEFAKQLAKNGEVVVFDAFPQAHRKHASVTGILRHLPSCAGFYCLEEVASLSSLLESPQHPFTMIIGGVKISDKISAMVNLWDKVDNFLVGGAAANVFLKAQGVNLGDSVVEEVTVSEATQKQDWLQVAHDLVSRDANGKIVLPVDFVVGDLNMDSTSVVSRGVGIEPGFRSLDIGPQSISLFKNKVAQSKTIFWNGPLGLIEDERFDQGSKEILQEVAKVSGTTVVSGGDTTTLVHQLSLEDRLTHVSLAGGATLEFLAGHKLPALELLKT